MYKALRLISAFDALRDLIEEEANFHVPARVYYYKNLLKRENILLAGALKYPFSNQVADRTHSGVLKAMVEAVRRKEPVFGIKGPSTLVKLQGFDLVWGLPPDYMHCVLEGVTKQVTEMWLSAANSSCYIGRHLKLIDSRLRLIKPPIIFSTSG